MTRINRAQCMVGLLAALASCSGLAASNQDILNGKLFQPGFNPEQVYQAADIDDVNLFNGNLTINLPIGPRYPVRDGFGYQFQLTYNSKIWSFVSCSPNPDDFPCNIDPADPTFDLPVSQPGASQGIQGIANPKNNVGAGWRLTLGVGELYGPTIDNPQGTLAYVEPSGMVAGFKIPEFETQQNSSQFKYPRYLFNGTKMLRVRVTAPAADADGLVMEPRRAEVDLPDGRTITYARPNSVDKLGNHVRQAPNGRWDLISIRDAFDNTVNVQETHKIVQLDIDLDGNADTVAVPDKWTVTDPFGRTQTVSFDDKGMVTKVALAGFDNSVSTYSFHRELGNPIPGGCPTDLFNTEIERPYYSVQLPLLKEIRLPSKDLSVQDSDPNDTFEFSYYPASVETNVICSTLRGRLKDVTLPTKGTIEYTYGNYNFPNALRCLQNSGNHMPSPAMLATHIPGVIRKLMKDRDGTVVGRVEYKGSPLFGWGGKTHIVSPDFATASNPPDCELPDVTYTDVYSQIQGDLYRLTRHFFSIHHALDANDEDEVDQGWSRFEYGLSLDRYSPDPNDGGRYRSSMTFECSGIPVDASGFLNPTIDLASWPEDRRQLAIPDECSNRDNKLAGQKFASPTDVHGIRDQYVAYEGGNDLLCDGSTITNGGGCDGTFWRPISERTYFWDDKEDDPKPNDPNHKAPRFRTVERSRFDEFGHYKTTIQTAHFGFGPDQDPLRSIDTEFNSTHPEIPGPGTPWVLNIFSQRKVTAGQGNTSIVDYEFNADTGTLRTRRARRGISQRDSDLKVKFAYTSEGNVESASFSGGFGGGADAGSPVHYKQVGVYSSGVLARSDIVDANGNTVLRTADAISADGTSMIDQNTGLPKTSWDKSGIATSYTYDGLWRISRVVPGSVGSGVPTEAATDYVYQSATATTPAIATVKRDLGSSPLTQTTFQFDGLGRIIRKETLIPGNRANAQWMTYTATGKLAQKSTVFESGESADGVTSYDYDVFGRVQRIEAPDGEIGNGTVVTRFDYQGDRRKKRTIKDIKTRDGSLKDLVTIFLDNGKGQLVTVKQGEQVGATFNTTLLTNYQYDEGGRVAKVVQTNSTGQIQTRTFTYDGAGLLVQESHPELDEDVTYGRYDSIGNVGFRQLGAGSPFDLTYSYDRAGRLISVSEASTGRRLKEFYFNQLYQDESYKNVNVGGPALGNGKVFQAKRHHYDDAVNDTVVTETSFYGGVGGRLSRRSVRTGGSGTPPRVYFASGDETSSGFSYDRLGNLQNLGYPKCAQAGCGNISLTPGLEADVIDTTAPDRTIERIFQRGLLTSISDRVGGSAMALSSFSYYPNLLPSVITHHNDVSSGGTTSHSADILDVIDNDPDGLPRPKQISAEQTNAAVLWTTGQYHYDGAGDIIAMGADTFAYDAIFGHLSSASIQGISRSYEYDDFGNLTSIGTGSETNARTIDASTSTNRMTDNIFSYDVAGNLIRAASWKYGYDAFGTLRSIDNPAFSPAVGREYLYSAENERVAIINTVDQDERWTLRSPAKQVIREYRYDGSAWRWGIDYVHRGSIPLASYTENGSLSGEVHHYSVDHLGTPRLITRGDGAQVAQNDYMPYGEEIGPSAGVDNLKFTGHERDDVDPGGQGADLDYMHSRFYNAEVGRFFSMDTEDPDVSSPQGWNRYAYGQGNPLRNIDPTGRAVATYVRKWQASLEAAKDRFIDEFVGDAVQTGDNDVLTAAVAATIATVVFDLPSEALDPLRLGDAAGEAWGSQDGALGKTQAVVVEIGRAAALLGVGGKALKAGGKLSRLLASRRAATFINEVTGTTRFTAISGITRTESGTVILRGVGEDGKGVATFINDNAVSDALGELSKENLMVEPSELSDDVIEALDAVERGVDLEKKAKKEAK